MLIIEYFNIMTQGIWLRYLGSSRFSQYLLAALLGATPGCMGAFIVVALFTHRRMTLGALVAAMITTSGGEMFVMLALIPQTALALTVGMFIVGLGTGWLTDNFRDPEKSYLKEECLDFTIHDEKGCRCFSKETFFLNWKNPSVHRIVLTTFILLILFTLLTNQLGPNDWDWKKILLLSAVGIALFIIITVPEHFMFQHLWRHIVCQHVPQIFLWTWGVLATIHALNHFVDVNQLVNSNQWMVLAIATLVGIIPETGPHLFFVTLYANGHLPFGILAANSIVQDGHGLLPLLAVSRKAFLQVKMINIVIGLFVGGILLFLENDNFIENAIRVFTR